MRTRFACVGEARPCVVTSSPESLSFFANACMKAMFASSSFFGQARYCA